MNKPPSTLLKTLLTVASALLILLAAGFAAFYLNIRAKELPVESARDYIRLEPGDTVLHAFTGKRWLDSQRYFVVQADPAGFDERIQRLSAQEGQTVRVTTGAGRDLWYRTEPVPSWWDVDSLEQAVAVDSGDHRRGELSIFSKERGRIYILDR
jgi:hypothetical protein